jgi:hypothetical protein
MPDQTDRLRFPLLIAGQAQKEMTHNEALALADILVQPIVQSVAPVGVPASPTFGQCWIVGASATGAWTGQDGAIACWTSGGWRFSAPFEGMTAWSVAYTATVRRSGAVWTIGTLTATKLSIGGNQVVSARQAAIPNPGGGATIDSEARVALAAILSALRTHGLIFP